MWGKNTFMQPALKLDLTTAAFWAFYFFLSLKVLSLVSRLQHTWRSLDWERSWAGVLRCCASSFLPSHVPCYLQLHLYLSSVAGLTKRPLPQTKTKESDQLGRSSSWIKSELWFSFHLFVGRLPDRHHAFQTPAAVSGSPCWDWHRILLLGQQTAHLPSQSLWWSWCRQPPTLHSWRHLQGCMTNEVQQTDEVQHWKHHFPKPQEAAVLPATIKKYGCTWAKGIWVLLFQMHQNRSMTRLRKLVQRDNSYKTRNEGISIVFTKGEDSTHVLSEIWFWVS